METLQRLVAESLARNGFGIPHARTVEESASVETRLAASPPESAGKGIEPAPLPSGF